MFRELSQAHVRFACGHCRHEWATDYDIRHVEDGHGHSADYYVRDGLPAVSPLAPGAVSCPRCGAMHLEMHVKTSHLAVTRPLEQPVAEELSGPGGAPAHRPGPPPVTF